MNNNDDDYAKMLSQIDPTKLQSVIDDDSPIFTEADLASTNQIPALIARSFIIKEGITQNKFEALCSARGKELHMPVNRMTSNRNNMLRSMHQPNMTFRNLEKLLLICGYSIVDLKLTIQNMKTNEVKSLSLQEIQQELADKPYKPKIRITDTVSLGEKEK